MAAFINASVWIDPEVPLVVRIAFALGAAGLLVAAKKSDYPHVPFAPYRTLNMVALLVAVVGLAGPYVALAFRTVLAENYTPILIALALVYAVGAVSIVTLKWLEVRRTA